MAQAGDVSRLSHHLDDLLLDTSYLSGWTPSQLDNQVWNNLSRPPPDLPNLLRWYNHIGTFSQKEREQLEKTQLTLDQLVQDKMVKIEDNLSPTEKKALICRNLQVCQ